MKIGFYAPLKPPDHPAPSGDRRMARLLIAALAGLGHQVTLISRLRSYNRDGETGLEAETAIAAAAEIERLTTLWQSEPAQRPDLLFTYHCYHKAADYLGPALKARFAIPYIIAEPSVAPKRQNGPWAKGYEQAGAAIRTADALLAITELDRACLAAFAGTDKIISLPPFLDPGPYRAAATRRDEHRRTLASRHELDQHKVWLLAVGMMRTGDKLASYTALAKALSLASDLPFQILVVGNGPERSTVERAFAGLGACFLGQQDADELADIYAACDLYVWPAVNEAYGLALLEAQAAGLPVLSVRTRGVPDIVRHGETGWLVDDHSPVALANALRGLLVDRHHLAQMSRSAADHVRQNLSMAAAQRRLLALFHQLGLPA